MAQTKVNWYSASKTLAARVLEFGDCKLWGIIHRKQAEQKIEKIQVKIDNLEALKGSILDDGDKLAQMKKTYEDEVADIEKDLKDALEKDAKFSYTDNDVKFYKAYKAATTEKDIKNALVAWVDFYGVKSADTKDINMLYDAIGGARRLGAGAIVRSNGTKFTDDKRTKGDVMGILYGKMCELLVSAGTIKLVQIPEDVRDAYAKKNKKNNNK